MSIDSMRVGGGRCPPLLVGGLVIACIMMVCNWWTLSSTNLELLRQIDELNEQIKISVEERDQCVVQGENTEKQLKVYQDDARTTHVKLSQVEDTLTSCNQELKSFQQMDITKNAVLDALRIDKNTISAMLNTKIEENTKLKEELKKVKDELEQVKVSVNAPQPKPSPLLPIARRNAISYPQLKPVKVAAVEISIPGLKGMNYHGIPILPQDPPGVKRLKPRFSVTMPKSQLLQKSKDKKQNTGENPINGADVQSDVKNPSIPGEKSPNPEGNGVENIPPNPQVNPPDAANPNQDDDTAAEVQEGNAVETDLNLNLMSGVKSNEKKN